MSKKRCTIITKNEEKSCVFRFLFLYLQRNNKTNIIYEKKPFYPIGFMSCLAG